MKNVKKLIAKGADIHAREQNGGMPLNWAATQGRAETVNALIAEGANIHARDVLGMLPVDWAKYNSVVRNDPVYWKLNEARY